MTGSKSKKEWAPKQLGAEYQMLSLQAIENNIVHDAWNESWNKQTAYPKCLQLFELLRTANLVPVCEFGVRTIGDSEERVAEPLGEAVAKKYLHPEMTIKQLAEEGHLSERMLSSVLRRMYDKHPKLDGELKKLTTAKMIDSINEKISMALDYIDHTSLAKSSAKDLALLVGIMIDKMRLLQGEPTQILSIKEAVNLRKLMPILIAEGERRGGITIEHEG